MFAPLQNEFAQALLDADRPVPDALTSRHADVPQKRFAVYRNNVVAGLVNAMREGFPVIERIVGEEFFAAMARCFVAAHPPQSPLLMHFGEKFADFIASFPPAADLPYLPDVARIAFARRRAYHAADAEPIDPATLAALAPERLAGLHLTLHPAVTVLRSRHPVVTIWAMNTGEIPLAPLDEERAEDALVARSGYNVTLRALPPGGARFIEALIAGMPLAAAAESASADDSRFDLAINLAGLIAASAITGFTIAEERSHD